MLLNHHEVLLVDDGTLDTVISVDGEQYRYDAEYAAMFRDGDGTLTEEGFIELAKESIEVHELIRDPAWENIGRGEI